MLQDRRVLYVISGSLIFGINMLLAMLIFSIPFSANPRWGNNIANIITTELMVVISFIIHNFFTWGDIKGHFGGKLFRFHLASALSLTLRTAAFAALDFAGLHYMAATLISIAMILLLNYMSFDRYAFRAAKDST